ncbi:hypothetical protein CI238_08039 [Colletotrichum incanum]|uniref:Uncharacterized protein n=1 Tax=Colletotrichum incanum TaxID=1573173 RepID=A0A161Y8Y5_COLIC|nr:hypothetical protein CI238_08039 [Colletotrichum incanum]OHW95752.1 hypothetical protein CSPAE12_05643 [Colletotrichum incanum]
MHFSYILLPVLAQVALSLGYCFDEGREGAYIKDQNILNLEDICGQLNGTYDRLQVSRVCVTDKIHVSWSFELKMIGPQEKRSISINECMSGMTKQLMCEHGRGGLTTYWNWRYKVKPNYGDTCFAPPYWKNINAYDPQDEPESYLCRVQPHRYMGCWDDQWSVPGTHK